MDKPQDRPPETAPARTVATNSDRGGSYSAPPTVSSAPSADTRGSAGTSTAEGPSRPKVPVPDAAAPDIRHECRGNTSAGEVDPPGERVDDETTGGKVTKRQE